MGPGLQNCPLQLVSFVWQSFTAIGQSQGSSGILLQLKQAEAALKIQKWSKVPYILANNFKVSGNDACVLKQL